MKSAIAGRTPMKVVDDHTGQEDDRNTVTHIRTVTRTEESEESTICMKS